MKKKVFRLSMYEKDPFRPGYFARYVPLASLFMRIMTKEPT